MEQADWTSRIQPSAAPADSFTLLPRDKIPDLIAFVRACGDKAKNWRDDHIRAGRLDEKGRITLNPATDIKNDPSPFSGQEGQRVTSFCTQMDRQLGRDIQQKLMDISGEDVPILNEEEISKGLNKTHYQKAKHRGDSAWIIDPIDGTTNFITPSKKHYGVLLGLVERGQPVFGIAYYPEYDYMLYTQDGKAWMEHAGVKSELKVDDLPHDKPLRLAAKLLTGQAEAMSQLKPCLDHAGLKTSDSLAAHATATGLDFTDMPAELPIAQGHADLAYIPCGNEWDYAARHAIFKAAGGECINAEGTHKGAPIRYFHGDNPVDPLFHGPVWCAHPNILKSLGLMNPHLSCGKNGGAAIT